MDGIVELVLHHLEEEERLVVGGVVIDRGGIEVEDLTVEHLLGEADVLDGVEQLVPILPATIALEAVGIDGEALDDIVTEALGGPLAEAHTLDAMDAIADGDDDIEVVEVEVCRLCLALYGTMWSGMCKFCTPHFGSNLTLFKDIGDVAADYGSVTSKQRGHLAFGQPHGVGIHLHIELDGAVLGGVEHYGVILRFSHCIVRFRFGYKYTLFFWNLQICFINSGKRV